MNSAQFAEGSDLKPSLLFELLSQAPALFWTADKSLRITSIATPGMHAADEPAHPFVGVYLPGMVSATESEQAFIDAHLRALRGLPTRFELTINGNYWLGSVAPLLGPAEQILGISAAIFDYTDRAFTEQSLRLSEQSYRSLIEEAPFSIARVTLSGQLLQVNRAMVEMLSYESEQELLLRSLDSEIFLNPRFYQEFVSGLNSGGPMQGFESVWRRRDGKSISVRLAARATRDDLGRISYLEMIAENTTDRKQLEQQLRQAQKLQAVGQLAGGIAHDFNNLLTIINGQIQMALGELPSSSPIRERLEDVESAADRASKLTRQLLAFGRLQNIEARVLNLNAIVSGLIQMLVLLVGKAIEIEFTPTPGLGWVSADPAQLEQVLMNLVLNAKDATPEGGRLTISAENVRLDSAHRDADAEPDPPGDYVALSVTDTGHGMSAETQAHIFEPFFTTKRPGQGTGLGLATVYSIVKQSKGFIETESELGKGTRFTIYLPRVAPPAGTELPTTPPTVRGGSETILFAEDEESIRKFTSTFLTRLGYRVLCAADGIEAIDIAKAHAGEIDLLVTDIVMPHMGGRELAETLRRTLPDLKILFISGYAGDGSVRDAIKAMNAQLMQKPFPSMPAFAKAIRDVLGAA
jgi:two-component system, cell cycle sensor histidine kinase and response regulator CckA